MFVRLYLFQKILQNDCYRFSKQQALDVEPNVANQNSTFTITETTLYVPVVTLSTQDNAKLLPQLKSGFKRTVSWNKYLAKPELLA